MPREDFARYQQRLEEQLRSDMGLLYEAYLAKLRAYQAVERLREEVDFENPPAPAVGLSFQLPPVPAPAAPAAAPAPGPPRRSKAYEVIDAVQAALERLPRCSTASTSSPRSTSNRAARPS